MKRPSAVRGAACLPWLLAGVLGPAAAWAQPVAPGVRPPVLQQAPVPPQPAPAPSGVPGVPSTAAPAARARVLGGTVGANIPELSPDARTPGLNNPHRSTINPAAPWTPSRTSTLPVLPSPEASGIPVPAPRQQ